MNLRSMLIDFKLLFLVFLLILKLNQLTSSYKEDLENKLHSKIELVNKLKYIVTLKSDIEKEFLNFKEINRLNCRYVYVDIPKTSIISNVEKNLYKLSKSYRIKINNIQWGDVHNTESYSTIPLSVTVTGKLNNIISFYCNIPKKLSSFETKYFSLKVLGKDNQSATLRLFLTFYIIDRAICQAEEKI